MTKILLIEDDPIISKSLQIALELEQFDVVHKTNLREGKLALQEMKYDLILLDINLPDGKGYNFCKDLRNENCSIPIIAITANSDEETAIKTLGHGANDYVRKPFSTKELLLRIRIRTDDLHLGRSFKVDRFVVDVEKRTVTCEEGELNLARKEFDLFVTFAKRLDHIFSREAIIEVLDTGSDINDRTIDSHISHLRTKMKLCECHRLKIRAVYGLGYKMQIDDE